jgi:hypothetical protein
MLFLLTVKKNSNVTAIKIVLYFDPSQGQSHWNYPNYSYYFRLYRAEGEDKFHYATSELELTGNVPSDIEKC